MFTGIITDIGTIETLTTEGDWFARIAVKDWDLSDVEIGASIACNGICLTVISKTKRSFDVQLSAETVARTTAKDWHMGTAINLERALKMGDELGGHLVSGHVDGVGKITAITASDDSQHWQIEAPEELAALIAYKGSITVEGVSLTVNAVAGCVFDLMLIPHTLAHTTLGCLREQDTVNLEVDLFARYVQRQLSYKKTNE